mmetsp:Transcript_130478/g.260359  ORF Transcript_130478/g.260359 Transcript_130478/m.260359 type:complete len:110 (+) Transcript_130478:478-807(+)
MNPSVMVSEPIGERKEPELEPVSVLMQVRVGQPKTPQDVPDVARYRGSLKPHRFCSHEMDFRLPPTFSTDRRRCHYQTVGRAPTSKLDKWGLQNNRHYRPHGLTLSTPT